MSRKVHYCGAYKNFTGTVGVSPLDAGGGGGVKIKVDMLRENDAFGALGRWANRP